MTLKKKYETCNLVLNLNIMGKRKLYRSYLFLWLVVSFPLFVWVLQLSISDCRRGVMLSRQHLGSFEGRNIILMFYSFSLQDQICHYVCYHAFIPLLFLHLSGAPDYIWIIKRGAIYVRCYILVLFVNLKITFSCSRGTFLQRAWVSCL